MEKDNSEKNIRYLREGEEISANLQAFPSF